MSKQRPAGPRRLLALYILTTLVPAASLGWLGWRMVEQDRVLEGSRVEERRDQAVDLAATALQRILAEAEETLTTFGAASGVRAAELRDGAALVVFSNAGAIERAGTTLPYYPAVPASPQPSVRFTEADELEFRTIDLARALRAVREIAEGPDPVLRAEATLRMARIHRKMGNQSLALEAFGRLSEFGQERVDGGPAGLTAEQGRALIFQAADRREELREAGAVLCAALAAGRWLVTRAEFEFSYQQAQGWASCPPVGPDRLALAAVADSVWRQWQTNENQPPARDRRTFRSGERSVLVLTRSSPGRMAALLMGSAFLEFSWRHALGSVVGQSLEFALTDANGRTVLGHPDVPLARQSVRPASATQLPWTVHAIDEAEPSRLSGRTRLLLGGIGFMAVIVLSGGYVINRALLREVRVAQLQSDFVAAVSHEFRTPLTTLRQLSEMLVRGRVSSDHRRQQFYETLLQESERLHRLVESLLDFGRMEAGEVQYRFECVEPDGFIRSLVTDFQKEVSGIGYTIELHETGTLPLIRADRESLARVFWNLLDNAVKYSPEHRTIWVDVCNPGKRLMIRVRDRGLGIPATEQQDIFRKFMRGAASKNASIRGTGIGLAIARQIVQAHGGDISVESQPGQGSVFTVLLPVAES
jgi:signal transduction histidine kinase